MLGRVVSTFGVAVRYGMATGVWMCRIGLVITVRPGQFQTGPLGLGPVIEESLGSPAKQEQGSQSDRVCTENKQQYSPGNTQNRVLSRAGLT